MDKHRKDFRRTLIKQRSNLTLEQQQQLAYDITQRLVKTDVFLRSTDIGFYYAHKGEVDTTLLLQEAHASGKNCFLPILHPLNHNELWFAHYSLDFPLKRNTFGILEPDISNAAQIAAPNLDLVLTPLVAFDSFGTRLGMGGGYYDRTFAFLLGGRHVKPRLVGLAYEFQKVEKIPRRPWDVPLDFVVTEQHFYACNKKI